MIFPQSRKKYVDVDAQLNIHNYQALKKPGAFYVVKRNDIKQSDIKRNDVKQSESKKG